jgi:undecaprenyl-diphosphatase
MWSAALSNLDLSILYGLNVMVGRSTNLDKIIDYLADTDLVATLFVSLFWWCWFSNTDVASSTRTREHVLRTLFGGVVAIFAARILALTLPFRVRPRFDPALHFVAPVGSPTDLVDWSGFPSDHAVMFAALAAGLCFISRRAGAIAFLYAFFLICLPRVYLGLHYPSDIVAGLTLGAAVGYWMNVAPVSGRLASRALRCESASPAGFYLVLFIVSFEFSTMFFSLRTAALSTARFAAHLASAL